MRSIHLLKVMAMVTEYSKQLATGTANSKVPTKADIELEEKNTVRHFSLFW